jgi:ABC-type Mn2+/Zn2+ transport system ATPase subunit
VIRPIERLGWRAYGPWDVRPLDDGPALAASSVVVRYDHASTNAVDDVSITVDRGTCVRFLGENGAGKSTFLKAVAGLLAPASGSIEILGVPAGWCRRRVAYLPQRGELDWEFPIDVRGLVGTGRYVHRGWLSLLRGSDRDEVRRAMDAMRIGDLASKQIGMLSGGQQQRTLLARTLAQDAELLVLDEPTSSMDAASIEVVVEALAAVVAAGRTILVSTHDAELFASLPGRAVRMERGRIVSDEPVVGRSGRT